MKPCSFYKAEQGQNSPFTLSLKRRIYHDIWLILAAIFIDSELHHFYPPPPHPKQGLISAWAAHPFVVSAWTVSQINPNTRNGCRPPPPHPQLGFSMRETFRFTKEAAILLYVQCDSDKMLQKYK
jgi:hypothetical protein